MALVVGSGWIPMETALAHAEGAESEPTLLERLRDEARQGFSSRIDLLGFAIAQSPVGSGVNPNNILHIPRLQAEVDVRPDLRLSFRQLELSAKPRLEWRWRRWADGVRQGDSEADAEVFVQEWLARYRLSDGLFASYGRENLQWGPSALVSPSNPFNRDNGQNNPRLEVPGLDYGRVVWLPGNAWTLSFIANIDRGRQEMLRDFRKTYAMKLDFTGENTYVSLIPSYREDEKPRVGVLGGWTVSDGLLVYTEGRLSDAIDEAAFLVGGSYTLERGPTVVAELFRDGSGCALKPIALCLVPGVGNADAADILLRRHYLLLQYMQRGIGHSLNLIFRWIRNLDDDSNRMIGILEYEPGDRTQLFVIGSLDRGKKDAEFGSLIHYSLMAGVRWTL